MTIKEIAEAKKYPAAIENIIWERYKTQVKVVGEFPNVNEIIVVGEVDETTDALINEFMWGFLAGNKELRDRLVK